MSNQSQSYYAFEVSWTSFFPLYFLYCYFFEHTESCYSIFYCVKNKSNNWPRSLKEMSAHSTGGLWSQLVLLQGYSHADNYPFRGRGDSHFSSGPRERHGRRWLHMSASELLISSKRYHHWWGERYLRITFWLWTESKCTFFKPVI